MKKILVAVVLGFAVVAVAQNPAQPAQGQQPAAAPAAQGQQPSAPAAPGQPAQAQPAPGQPAAQGQQPAASQAQAPVIKDPAEYNAYVAAVQSTDPNA